MLLPVVCRRTAGIERAARAHGAGPSVDDVSFSSASGGSQLTPPIWRSSQGSSSGSQKRACGDSFSQSSSYQTQTCTPVLTQASPSDGRPSKKMRPAEPVPYEMMRLSKTILRRNKGLFVTGGGGVGKTRLLRQVADEHRDAQGGGRAGLHVLAPTGVAAAAAGGVTIHCYLRLPAGCFDETM